MIRLDNFDALLTSLELTERRPLLIGIDGRPCSGKSTLTDLLIKELHAEGLFLDDFFIPQTEWPNHISPAFPFPYFRYNEFVQGVCRLAKGMLFEYQPYNWATNRLEKARIIDPKNIIIVEGVSVLCEQLVPCFYKKIFVESNKNNEFEAICQRENKNINIWSELYLPSIDIYWRTNPWERADILYSGRGLPDKEAINLFLG